MLAPRVDKLNRRKRFLGVQPQDKRIVVSDDDVRMWKAIHDHGPLPTHYLFAFSKKKDYNTLQHRLTKQRHGTEEHGPYLVRSPIPCSDPLSTTNVYTLHDKAKDILIQKNVYSKNSTRRGWAVHQLMGSCITASIELTLPKGLTFIPRHLLLDENKKSLKLTLPNRFILPDELFEIEYGDRYRYFVCEWDRDSETKERLESKLTDYLEAIRADLIRKNTMVMIVTTTNVRAQWIVETLQRLDKNLAKRFLINVLEHFDHPWKMPPILTTILDPWLRGDGTMFDIKTAP